MPKNCQNPMAIRQAVLHEKEITLPEKKAGGLMAISRSVTEGNHRKQSQNNSRALEARSENNLNALLSFQKAEG